jgi:hypothetical protein
MILSDGADSVGVNPINAFTVAWFYLETRPGFGRFGWNVRHRPVRSGDKRFLW